VSGTRRPWAILPLLTIALAILAGCATSPPRTAFTPQERASAQPMGFGDIRYNDDADAYVAMLKQASRPNDKGEVNVLALSGGGANGAYGAGLINGWSKTGNRPQFQIVTGISTGALIAPFAFLGPTWDERLKEAYTGEQIQHLLQQRGVLDLLRKSFFRKGPLVRLVRGYVTDDLIAAVAAEHAKGRRLLVATTDLDTQQLIVWDLGAIAAHGGPQARQLFGEVLIASASIPGVFSPSMITVTSGAHTFTEMHVDGQTETAFFAVPPPILMATAPLPKGVSKLHLYVIANGRLDYLFSVTEPATLPILRRTLDVAAKASIRTSITTTIGFCHYRGCDLKISSLPTTVEDSPLDFSGPHLKALFAAGENAEASGTAWNDGLPR
jgi:hypothetical protein